MLRSRIGLLLRFVQDIEVGLIPHDHEILLEISSLCARLPSIQGNEFSLEFNKVRISDLGL
jgi:COP9 signalosome complex subunit 6